MTRERLHQSSSHPNWLYILAVDLAPQSDQTNAWALVVFAVVLVMAACNASSDPIATVAPTTQPASTPTVASVSPDPTSIPSPLVGRTPAVVAAPERPLTGADQLALTDFAELHGKRVGIIVNQTSLLSDGQHLIDALNDQPLVDLALVFAPEHGVRGSADAGELVDDVIDESSGIAIRSLYGANRSPALADLRELDVLVYDLQDAGTRFYTFISTMGLAMGAADAAGIEFIVLDRPNPLGGTLISGFARTADQESFISQYPIPAVYGMTPGELALMIAGEGWMGDRVLPPPTVVAMSGWTRQGWPETREWIAPSPGLPTIEATITYPGTVVLEATRLSYGKGTEIPFSMVGSPTLDHTALADDLNTRALPGVLFRAFEVMPDPEIAPNPRFPNESINAVRIIVTDPVSYRPVETGIYLLTALRDQFGSTDFIDRAPTFDLLAGTTQLRTMLDSGATAPEIVAAWEAEAAAFSLLREPYLLY